jgi:spore coat polysaccharide biosynthesis predicted glycosyltransferase SpsG
LGYGDVLIIDSGDTYPQQVATDQYTRIVTFEDRGPGAMFADATINSLVSNPYFPSPEYKGPEYAFIRSEFLGLEHDWDTANPNWILMAFGGSDAKDLGSWVSHMIRERGFTPKLPSDFPTMAEAFLSCALTISGAGQVVHEAAYLGVPTITMAATLRESLHTHLGPEHGNLYLGYAGTVTDDQLRRAIVSIPTDKMLRAEMKERGQASVDGKGADRILHILEGLLI